MRYSKNINDIFFKVETLINNQTKKLIGWVGTILEHRDEHIIFINPGIYGVELYSNLSSLRNQ